MDCPNCYVNASPESVPVQVTNLAVATSLGDELVKWVNLTFHLADSASTDGRTFLLADGAEEYEIADVKEVEVIINNITQPPTVYAISGDVTQVILAAEHAITADDVVRVKALVRVVAV
jgi:hypothetical protein